MKFFSKILINGNLVLTPIYIDIDAQITIAAGSTAPTMTAAAERTTGNYFPVHSIGNGEDIAFCVMGFGLQIIYLIELLQ